MKFTKMQGLGNDYVYVNCFKETVSNPTETARFVSDRHFGIGADGLIMINPSEKADIEMEMYNAAGSRGEMCGNRIRCVAQYVYDYGLTDKTRISIETLGGIKYLDLTARAPVFPYSPSRALSSRPPPSNPGDRKSTRLNSSHR